MENCFVTGQTAVLSQVKFGELFCHRSNCSFVAGHSGKLLHAVAVIGHGIMIIKVLLSYVSYALVVNDQHQCARHHCNFNSIWFTIAQVSYSATFSTSDGSANISFFCSLFDA